MGADSYEKEINEYFWIYGESLNNEKFVGTIEKGGYRFSDNHICFIEKIGWNKNFIIVKSKFKNYYIQPIIENISVNKMKKYLKGPFTESQFLIERKKMKIPKSLKFKIIY